MNKKERSAAYYQANKDRIKAKQAEYYYNNKEKKQKSNKAWKEANKESYQKWLEQYRENNRAVDLISKAKHRAKTKNAICSLTREWVQSKIDFGFCEVTGLPFNLKVDKSKTMGLYSPSLDRIDNSNPNYTEDNVRVVLWGVNMLRNEHEFKDLLPIMEALIKNAG